MSYIGTNKLGKVYLGTTEIAKAYLGSNLVYQYVPPPQQPCLKFESSSINTISVSCYGTAAPVLYYSTNKTNWTLWDYSAQSFSSSTPIYIYGNNQSTSAGSTSNYFQFVLGGSGYVSCSGNIMTLIDGTETNTTIPRTYCFYKLFRDCTLLVSAPELPATTLTSYCYYQMFYGCTSLEHAPSVLPSLVLTASCYSLMFQNCTSLTTAPEIPEASTNARNSCSSMFKGCSNLNYVKCLVTSMSTTVFGSWLRDVSATGTFIKNPNLTSFPSGYNGIPSGWTIIDYSG